MVVLSENNNLIKDDVMILKVQCVIFPQVRMTVPIPSQSFEELCSHCEKTDQSMVGLLAMKRRDPRGNEMYNVGTYVRLLSHQRSQINAQNSNVALSQTFAGQIKNSVSLGVQGRHRFRILEWKNEAQTLAKIELIPEPSPQDTVKIKALCSTIQDYLMRIMENQTEEKLLATVLQQGGLQRGIANGRWSNNPGALADLIGITAGQLSIHEKQQILETIDIEKRLELTCSLLIRIHEANRVSQELQKKLHQRNEDELKEQILRRQMGEIQRELRKIKNPRDNSTGSEDGAEDEEEDEIVALRMKIEKAGLSEQAHKIAKNEMKRLQSIQPHHPEYNVCRTYLETLASLPWQVSSPDSPDLEVARRILDEDHFGLESVKKRILEFLAVRQLRKDMKGPILCLHGPPGVGKTSLGKSIARALGRKFHRLALGGVRDEAEIRGHRRTYIGAMPGVFIQCLQQVGTNNPLVLLDEVDKLSHNQMFNPQGALLEILDSEQNHTFRDHYLGVPFDLSNIFFIATCNEYDTIDRPLLDRMEVIEIAGYTLLEKKYIAINHLLQKQRVMHALIDENGRPLLEIQEEAMELLISRWTRESGVRGLERRIAEICRWAACKHVEQERASNPTPVNATVNPPTDVKPSKDAGTPSGVIVTPSEPKSFASTHIPITVTKHMLPIICGIEISDHLVAERLSVGVSMGLAVTTVGGELLFIETALIPGTRNEGPLLVTGQLGNIMKESVLTSVSLLKSRNLELKSDLHVHFPAGAVPKDGPSAGVATTMALISLIIHKPLRSDTACTGEITLRGNVLPVGGIKEKVIAAHRAGIKYVLLPHQNKRHVEADIPKALFSDITIIYLKNIDDATKHYFGCKLSPESLSMLNDVVENPTLNSLNPITVPENQADVEEAEAHEDEGNDTSRTALFSPRTTRDDVHCRRHISRTTILDTKKTIHAGTNSPWHMQAPGAEEQWLVDFSHGNENAVCVQLKPRL